MPPLARINRCEEINILMNTCCSEASEKISSLLNHAHHTTALRIAGST